MAIDYTQDTSENISATEEPFSAIEANVLGSLILTEEIQRAAGVERMEDVFLYGFISAFEPARLEDILNVDDLGIHAIAPADIRESVVIQEIHERVPIINLRYRSKLKPLFYWAELRK